MEMCFLNIIEDWPSTVYNSVWHTSVVKPHIGIYYYNKQEEIVEIKCLQKQTW